jgi:murein DD-endopeptidase MepM/ murein hydrolase activator NlpD
MCPVQGPRAFTNDWGQPRSGGRRHQGTDILSPRGTPVVASVSGSVRGHNSSLGGISYYLNGDDGNTYFGTHLDSLAGVSGRVSQGTVVGYVGNTGNARGGPTHLHFEIHPGGGGPVNPYPTLAQYC